MSRTNLKMVSNWFYLKSSFTYPDSTQIKLLNFQNYGLFFLVYSVVQFVLQKDKEQTGSKIRHILDMSLVKILS